MSAPLGGVVSAWGGGFANQWGGVLLLASCTAVVALWCAWTLSKWRAGRRWCPLAAGTLRLAAARGAVAQLELLAHLPVSRGLAGRRRRRRRRRLAPVTSG